MNKTISNILLALPFIMAATSCSEGDVVIEGTGDAVTARYIGVDVQTQRNTRGAVADLNLIKNGAADNYFRMISYYTGDKSWADYVQDGNFNVYTAENPFKEERYLKWSGKKWKYDKLVEWPEVGNTTFISFFYKKYGVYSTTFAENKSPKYRLEQIGDTELMPDILYAITPNCTPDQNGGKVKVKFKHLCARVNFKISMDKPFDPTWGNAAVVPENLKILKESRKLRSGIDFVIGQTDLIGSKPIVGQVATKCYFDEEGATSRSTDVSADKVIKKDRFFEKKAVDQDPVLTASLFKDNEYMFLIPPSVDGVQTKEDIIVEFSYYFYTDKNGSNISNLKKSTFSLPIGSLKPGKAYLFNLILNPTENYINPKVELEEWSDIEKYVAETEAADATSENVIKAWNKLVKQSETTDVMFTYYVLKVNADFPVGELDISSANKFKKPASVVKMEFKTPVNVADVKAKIKLPSGYYIDETVGAQEIIIRYKKPKGK